MTAVDLNCTLLQVMLINYRASHQQMLSKKCDGVLQLYRRL